MRSAASTGSVIADYGEPLQIAPGIRATFYDAGHILARPAFCSKSTRRGYRSSCFPATSQ